MDHLEDIFMLWGCQTKVPSIFALILFFTEDFLSRYQGSLVVNKHFRRIFSPRGIMASTHFYLQMIFLFLVIIVHWTSMFYLRLFI